MKVTTRLDFHTSWRRLSFALLFLISCLATSISRASDYDVVVYGGTPAGIAAAIAAADLGHTVLLVEPSRRLGGMVTNGLSHPDFRTFEAINGAYRELTQQVQAYYDHQYGANSPQSGAALQGTEAEPKVNLLIFEQMLAARPSITVDINMELTEVELSGSGNDQRIVSITLIPTDQRAQGATSVSGRVFIDATYEGDFMAAVGVEYRVGRESRDEFGESLAPENGDSQVQGYNFRLIVTRNPENRVFPSKPAGYQRDDFLNVLEMFAEGALESVFCSKKGGIFKAHLPELPNGKHDVNDVSKGAVRLSMPSINDGWPEGNNQTREAIFAEHVRHSVGLLYFLQNDDAVPREIQNEAREWGWCRDEFTENRHLPVQLYVREGRRMVGQHVYTQNDTDWAEGDARSKLHTNSIAIGDYAHNCHGTGHEGPLTGGRHTGEFYKSSPPYQVPYGVLVPKQRCSNLLVPGAVSSSHVGFCALRLEPIWMSLGEAAGVAAHLTCQNQIAVQDVDVPTLQSILNLRGAATVYVSDVLPGHPDYAAVQWWGTQGGLHGLASKGQVRGKFIVGQYYEAYANHRAELDATLTDETRSRWLQLVASLSLDTGMLADARTRGMFIRKAFLLHK